MARRGTPWGPSNPLWRWQHKKSRRRRKASKAPRKRRRRSSRPRKQTMARRRYYSRRRSSRRGMKIPIVSLAILAGQGAAAYDGTFLGTLGKLGSFYTGFDIASRSFQPENLLVGYGPWLAKRFLLPIARPRLGGMHLPVSIS